MDDKKFLQFAIEKSKESSHEGRFPAGAIVVKGSEILAEGISGKYPRLHEHAEYKAMDSAINKVNEQLSDSTLYCSMEPCLMCLSKAYWVGIRRVVFATPRKSVDKTYFEGTHDNQKLIEDFNEKIELIHFKELEDEALDVVRKGKKKEDLTNEYG